MFTWVFIFPRRAVGGEMKFSCVSQSDFESLSWNSVITTKRPTDLAGRVVVILSSPVIFIIIIMIITLEPLITCN